MYAIFTPMHFLGMAGNPRRYSDFTNVEYLAGLMPVHKFMTQAAYFTAAAQIIFLINLFWSMKKGAKAPIIRGTPPRSNGPFLRRRRSTISPACIPWSITVRMNTACRARRRISSCRPILLRSIPGIKASE